MHNHPVYYKSNMNVSKSFLNQDKGTHLQHHTAISNPARPEQVHKRRRHTTLQLLLCETTYNVVVIRQAHYHLPVICVIHQCRGKIE